MTGAIGKYVKLYDDYENGTWLVQAVDSNGYLLGSVLADGLSEEQAQSVCDSLNAVFVVLPMSPPRQQLVDGGDDDSRRILN